jgi:hypothetical protein
VKRLSLYCPFLFQKPRNRPENGVYYHNAVVGQNKLGSMMSEISDRANLSVRYTNHSLRATTVHILDRAQVPSRHIMTVTGHKSENSLKTYSGLTDEGTKKRMSNVISMKSCATYRPRKLGRYHFPCLGRYHLTWVLISAYRTTKKSIIVYYVSIRIE